MNNKITTPEEFALARDLHDRGVSFDEDELERMGLDCSGLSILQNCDFPSTAFDVPGGAGYVFNALVYNDSPRRYLAPSFIGFECPPWDFEMRLLQDPRKKTPRENLYSFSDRRQCEFEFERAVVLNHLIGRRHILAPGEVLEGYVLAVGRVVIPSKYRDRDQFDVRLRVFDQWGRSDEEVFHLLVERGAEIKEMLKRIATGGQPRRNITSAASELAKA
jgi:hypothetical protein